MSNIGDNSIFKNRIVVLIIGIIIGFLIFYYNNKKESKNYNNIDKFTGQHINCGMMIPESCIDTKCPRNGDDILKCKDGSNAYNCPSNVPQLTEVCVNSNTGDKVYYKSTYV